MSEKETPTKDGEVKEKEKSAQPINVIKFEEVQSAIADTSQQFEEKVAHLQKHIDEANKQYDEKIKTIGETVEQVDKITKDLLEAQKEAQAKVVAMRQTDYTIEGAEDNPAEWAKDIGFGVKRYKNKVVGAYEDLMTRKVVTANRTGLTHEHNEKVTNSIRKLRYYNDLIVLEAVRKSMATVDDVTGDMIIDKDWLPKAQYFKKWETLKNKFEKSLSLTTTYGGDWVPTGMSSEVTDLIELQPYLPNFFPQITMPTSPYDVPSKTARGTVYFVGENTNDEGVKYPASTPTTSKTTFTAKKFAQRVLFSDEIAQDSLPNIYNFVVSDMAPNFARAREDTIINGDTTSPHMDSDITNPNDHRKALNGLRDLCATGSDRTSISDYMTAVKILTIRNSMGVHASGDCALVIPVTCLNYLLILQDDSTNKNRLTVTANAGGPFFTLWNGLPFESDNRSLLGMKLIVSEFIRENTNSSAVYQSGQTATMFFIVNQQGFAVGSRKMFTLESDRDIDVGQTKVVAMDRWDFQKRYASTVPVAWEGYYVTSGVA